MTRVSDLAQNKVVASIIQNTQARINDRQIQISSLQKSQDYAGIAQDSNRLVTLENSRARIDQFMNDNIFVQLRIEAQLNSMDALGTTVDDMKGLLTDLLDDGELPQGLDKNEITDIKLNEFKDFLNVKVNGRYLFAGSKTDTIPVVPSDTTVAPTYDGTFTTRPEPSYYYQGDDTTLKARIDEGVTLNYGVTAAQPAFEKIFRAMRIVRSLDISGADPDYIAKATHALDLMRQGEDQLEDLELTVGTRLEQLQATNLQSKNTRDFFDGVITDLESADTFTAVAELTQDQTVLEASYNTLVRLSSLTLTNFL